jgi:hypothetical protein
MHAGGGRGDTQRGSNWRERLVQWFPNLGSDTHVGSPGKICSNLIKQNNQIYFNMNISPWPTFPNGPLFKCNRNANNTVLNISYMCVYIGGCSSFLDCPWDFVI